MRDDGEYEEYLWGPGASSSCPSQVAQDDWDYSTTEEEDRVLPELVVKCLKH